MNALLLIDLQNDFVAGGALPVPEGERVIPLINRLQAGFDLIVATQDWHPPDHGSFAANHPGREPGERIELDGLPQVLWPVHCVQGTHGAEFVAALDRSRVARVFRKGTAAALDSYSGFFDNGHRQATGLADYLTGHDVRQLTLVGLATDYCVKFSALDACVLGFRTVVVADACRGVDLEPGDVDRALDEMRAAGARVLNSEEL
jgi:nicotinamidase/pyrazinamidase